jgi:hypothetical protein
LTVCGWWFTPNLDRAVKIINGRIPQTSNPAYSAAENPFTVKPSRQGSADFFVPGVVVVVVVVNTPPFRVRLLIHEVVDSIGNKSALL